MTKERSRAMRSGKIVLVVASCLVVGVIGLVGGCSDDKTTAPPPVNQGDVQYDLVTAEVDQYLDTVIAQFVTGLDMASQEGGVVDVINVAFGPVNPDSIPAGEDGWNIVFATDLVSGYNSYRIDSIRFQRQNVPVTEVTNADEINVVHNWIYDNADTTIDYRNHQVRSVFEFRNINTDNATIFGTRNQKIETKTGTQHRDYNIDLSFSGVTISNANNGWNTCCPSTGQVTGTVELTQQSGLGLPTTTSWNFDITITDGTLAGTVTAGPYSRDYSNSICTLQ